jgi:hypothetical protein
VKRLISAVAIAMIAAIPALAGPLKLEPANPQPSGLKEGLAVSYTYPTDVKTLAQARKHLKRSKPGKPLSGLDYLDTINGKRTLTSKKAHHVVAGITGYVKFDKTGTYVIDFLSNDGLQATIGGQEVVFFDGRHACEESKSIEVSVPKAGWYDLKATYFQRTGTACLHMRAGIGEPDWMPNSAFGYN